MSRLKGFLWIFLTIAGSNFPATGPLQAQTNQQDTTRDDLAGQPDLPLDPWAILETVWPSGNGNPVADAVTPGLRPALANAGPDGAGLQAATGIPAGANETEAAGAPAEYLVRGFESRVDTVNGRRRTELDPAGLQAGSFTLFPEIEISTTHTDNLFATAMARKSDAKLSFRPSILVRSDWNRHALALAGEGEWGIYSHFKSENVLRGSLAGEARADLSRFSAAGLRLSIAGDQEGRGSPDALAGANGPVRFRTYEAIANLSQRLNRLVATLRGGVSLTDYDDIGLAAGDSDNNDDRDVATNSLDLRLAYELSPAVSVFGDLELDRRRFRQRFDDEGFQRSSSGWRATLGTSVEAGRLVRLDAEVGYVGRDYDDARLATISAFTADGRLIWAMTPLTTVRLGAGTDVAETTVIGASARVTRLVSVGVDHELLRQFIVSANLSFENQTLRGGDDETDTLAVSLGGEYRLGREASIVARIEREVETQNDNSGDVAETLVFVGVKLRR